MTQLQELLERCREQLHAVPGVTGTGLGLKQGTTSDIVICVFVRPSTDVTKVKEVVEALVGTDRVEIQAMDTPEGSSSLPPTDDR
ncbi:MAG: hypothetical protein GEV06_06200 [Luteitalea sp.]|nr:hypothetical protein [Luteitalea sp.]